MIDSYALIKAVHILSAAVLFGTGIGIAFFFWSARHDDDQSRLFAARTTVRADFLFTLPAVIAQPLTGLWLVQKAGFEPQQLWLVASYGLYALAGLCWIPVVWLQYRMMRMLETKVSGGSFDSQHFQLLRRVRFILGWPAFLSLIAVFFLMVAKPSW